MMSRYTSCLWLATLAAQFIFTVPAQAQAAMEEGAALLTSSGCAACHGAQGRGTTLAPPIVGSTLTEDAFRIGVRNARGAMPSYGVGVLSDDALDAIYAYVRTQQGADEPAGDADRGAELYERVGCYSCHSNQGQGIMHGPRIGPDPIRWDRFVWYVRNPTGQMPPYSATVLSNQDVADLRAFLDSRPQPLPVESIPLLAP